MHADTGTSRSRKRDSEATRAALLDAARELFGRHGYERVTLRDIGQRAGVDGSLIARYFGSKAALHRAAVDEDGRQVAAEPAADFASFTTEAIRRVDRRQAPGPLVQTLLQPGSDHAARVAAAEDMRGRLIGPLTAQLTAQGAADPETQAETLVAALMGVLALRPSGLFPALSAADPEQLGRLLGRFAAAAADEPPAP
ncbi:TetR family transcriptional regulator [Streptomyces luomodiensis]|uniref:TetR family transcriptional regulator n=1 Tax=Streptomyces luomodiensis TaxID=3026192 RepID=A0ABY9V7C1_9ACTN|nr:TetR family transcriptional regulator [Streptomyces sp. SCA4-21]WNF00788.1 TetR family transcriptional regulator [Streptomyces sp. SCA4-21]